MVSFPQNRKSVPSTKGHIQWTEIQGLISWQYLEIRQILRPATRKKHKKKVVFVLIALC